MSRPAKPKPAAAPKADAPQPAVQTTAALTPAATATLDAGQAAPKPESTLGDGDAAGAGVAIPSVGTAPEAPAPDVVKAPDGTLPSTKTPTPDAEPVPATQGHVVRVIGPAAGRWRAGRKFGPEAVEIPAADLTDEDMQKIFGDPQLVAQMIGAA